MLFTSKLLKYMSSVTRLPGSPRKKGKLQVVLQAVVITIKIKSLAELTGCYKISNRKVEDLCILTLSTFYANKSNLLNMIT